MRMRRLVVYAASVVFLLFCCIQKGTPTLMLTSMLMAVKGGLMMGKMTLGGLAMMLMAEHQNQQSSARHNIKIPFDILSLMSTSHSNNVKVTSAAAPTNHYLTTSPSPNPLKSVKRRIFRKRTKVRRDVSEQTKAMNMTNAKEMEELIAQEKEIQTRVYRQISNFDPMMCLPKVMCGINSTPPSKKTTILNDYAYLMKTILSRDDDDDKNKKPVTKNDKRKKKKKNKDDDSEETAEDYALDDEEFDRLALKEEADVEALVNDEMADEEPGFLPYILKDSATRGQSPADLNRQQYHNAGLQSDLPDVNAPPGFNFHGHGHERYPGPHRFSQQPEGPPASNSPMSVLSSYIPKIAFGKNQNDDFATDPFFDGFRRELRALDNITTLELNKTIASSPITKENEQILKEVVLRRSKRGAYLQRKKKELELSTDPADKFKIAAEVGKKLRSPRQCRALFNECPFKYTEVLGMINNLRKAVQGQAQIASSNVDKIMTLATKPIQLPQIPQMPQMPQMPQLPQIPLPIASLGGSSTKNVINVAAGGNTGAHGGITSISHQLPNGETVEINLKLMGQQASQSNIATPEETKTVKPLHPNDKEKIFDDDDEAVPISQPFNAATLQSYRDKIQSMESLESLKATIMAIEKINNATITRKKYGKPITYSGVFQEVTGIIPSKYYDEEKENSDPDSGSSSGSNEDDEEDEDLPLTQQNEVQVSHNIRQTPPQAQPLIRMRPQVHSNAPQQRIRQKKPPPPPEDDEEDSKDTTPSGSINVHHIHHVLPEAPRKKPLNYLIPTTTTTTGRPFKIRRPLRGTSMQDDPEIVPFTEKENVMNLINVLKNKKKPNKKEDEYDEEDVDGDNVENNTSEDEEEKEDSTNDDSSYSEQRLNIDKPSRDLEDDEVDEDRVVIKPGMPGHSPFNGAPPPNTHQQLQQNQGLRPPPHLQVHFANRPQQHPPHQQFQHHKRPPRHPSLRFQQQHMENQPSRHRPPPHPHRNHPNSPNGPHPPHNHPPSRFNHRTLQVYRGRSIDSRSPTTDAIKEQHNPNHRYPCGTDTSESSTTVSSSHNEDSNQFLTTTSTLPPPTLPVKYENTNPHRIPSSTESENPATK